MLRENPIYWIYFSFRYCLEREKVKKGFGVKCQKYIAAEQKGFCAIITLDLSLKVVILPLKQRAQRSNNNVRLSGVSPKLEVKGGGLKNNTSANYTSIVPGPHQG